MGECTDTGESAGRRKKRLKKGLVVQYSAVCCVCVVCVCCVCVALLGDPALTAPPRYTDRKD